MSIESKLAKIERIEDPLAREMAAHEIMEEIDVLEARASRCRKIAAAEALDSGVTLESQAEALGVTKATTQGLVRMGRELLAQEASESAKAIMAGQA